MTARASADLSERILAAAMVLPIEIVHLVDGLLQHHHPARQVHSGELRCSECGHDYPCNTVQLMAEALEVAG